jgi:hypothetical protein
MKYPVVRIDPVLRMDLGIIIAQEHIFCIFPIFILDLIVFCCDPHKMAFLVPHRVCRLQNEPILAAFDGKSKLHGELDYVVRKSEAKVLLHSSVKCLRSVEGYIVLLLIISRLHRNILSDEAYFN